MSAIVHIEVLIYYTHDYSLIRLLCEGLSKSEVSTGLIGGRVGNKGAVGISINLDGTTLLFVNAHLAGM